MADRPIDIVADTALTGPVVALRQTAPSTGLVIPYTKADGTLDSTWFGSEGQAATSIGVPRIAVITETILKSAFTDNLDATGTYQMADTVPAGAILLGSKVLVNVGFSGDTSAALIIGDGSDTDRYNTSTIDIFTTAATGVQSGVPSGSKLITTANRPTLLVTSGADFTNVVGTGSITVSIYYIKTIAG